MGDQEFYSLTEFKAFMDAAGVVRSRAEWQRRMRAGQFGRKIGTQYVIGAREARRILATFKEST